MSRHLYGRALVALGIATTLIFGSAYGANYWALQRPMNAVLAEDERNAGVIVSVHWDSYVMRRRLVYDLRQVEGSKSMLDVFRVFLQFAKVLKDREFTDVVLAWRGREKFVVPGSYFQQLGRDFDSENPVFTVRTFPSHLKNVDGSNAFGEWTGGLLGVLGKQMEDVTEFHRRWYLQDAAIAP